MSRTNLGHILRDTGRPNEAEQALGAALDLRRKLVDEFRTHPEYRGDLADTANSLASLIRANKGYDAARRLAEEAFTHIQAALNANPKSPSFREAYRGCLINLIESHLGLTNHAKAVEGAEELARFGHDSSDDLYDAACYVSRCILLAERDDRLPEAQRRERATAYANRAMQVLQQAIKRGFRDMAHMKQDTDLEPLRGRDDFGQLFMKVEPKPPVKEPRL
jgi:tetratricopeptide (TPR) repeat protein